MTGPHARKPLSPRPGRRARPAPRRARIEPARRRPFRSAPPYASIAASAARIAGRCPPATVAPCAAAGRARARASRHRSRRSRRRRRAGRPPDSPIRAHNERRHRPHARTPRAHRPRGRRSETRCRDCSRHAHRSRRPTLRGKRLDRVRVLARIRGRDAQCVPGARIARNELGCPACVVERGHGIAQESAASARRRSASERTSGDTRHRRRSHPPCVPPRPRRRGRSTPGPLGSARQSPECRRDACPASASAWGTTSPIAASRQPRDGACARNRRRAGRLESGRDRLAHLRRERRVLRQPHRKVDVLAARLRDRRGRAQVREDRVRRALAVPAADQRDHRNAIASGSIVPLTLPKGIGSSTTSTTR